MSSISKVVINIDFEIEIHRELDKKQRFAHQSDLCLNIDNVDEIIFNNDRCLRKIIVLNDDDAEHFCERF